MIEDDLIHFNQLLERHEFYKKLKYCTFGMSLLGAEISVFSSLPYLWNYITQEQVRKDLPLLLLGVAVTGISSVGYYFSRRKHHQSLEDLQRFPESLEEKV